LPLSGRVGLPNETSLRSVGRPSCPSRVPRHSKWQHRGIIPDYSKKDRTLYLVQSKYHRDGKGSIEVGEVHKFLKGVDDLIQARFDKFNNRIRSRKTELMDKLMDAQNKFSLVIIYSGKDKISTDCMNVLNDFLDKNNEISEQFYFTSIDVKDIYAFISSGAGHLPIDVEVAIHNWGYVQDPIKAIYGQVAGSDIAHWYRESGPHIFSPNIRVYLGNTEVNEGITSTVRATPELFWSHGDARLVGPEVEAVLHPPRDRRMVGTTDIHHQVVHCLQACLGLDFQKHLLVQIDPHCSDIVSGFGGRGFS